MQVGLGGRYEVVALPDGTDVEEAVEAYDPELIVLDITMPGPNGFAVCEKVRCGNHRRRIPVLFLTARKDDMSFIHAIAAGGDSLMTKPFVLNDLMDKVSGLIARNRGDHEQRPRPGEA